MYKKGDIVFVYGNSYGMNLKTKWPIKAKIVKVNTQGDGKGIYHELQFPDDNTWIYPENLINQKSCSVCGFSYKVSGKLFEKHYYDGSICYGSYMPISLGIEDI